MEQACLTSEAELGWRFSRHAVTSQRRPSFANIVSASLSRTGRLVRIADSLLPCARAVTCVLNATYDTLRRCLYDWGIKA